LERLEAKWTSGTAIHETLFILDLLLHLIWVLTFKEKLGSLSVHKANKFSLLIINLVSIMASIEEGSADNKIVTIDSVASNMINDETNAAASPLEEMSRLSSVGKMYDINGDGVLDEAEQAMRDLDETGRGYLTNDKVYELMVE
jgi:archaellum biogenesis ATPase FlaH